MGLPPRSKSPLMYSDLEEERRQREFTNQEKFSHQRSTSGNHQRHHFHDQEKGKFVQLKLRASSSHHSVLASTSFLDFGKSNSGRKTSTGRFDRNQEKSGRDIKSSKGFPCLGGSHKDYRNPFQKEPESRSAERARDLQWEQHNRDYYGHARPKFRDSGIKSRANSKDLANRDNEEWVGDGDKAEWEAQERIARGQMLWQRKKETSKGKPI